MIGERTGNCLGIGLILAVLFVTFTALHDESYVDDAIAIRNGAEVMWRVGHVNE